MTSFLKVLLECQQHSKDLAVLNIISYKKNYHYSYLLSTYHTHHAIPKLQKAKWLIQFHSVRDWHGKQFDSKANELLCYDNIYNL